MRTLLVSMPWADYHCPSLQIGTLAAYARKQGFDVEARHLHLDTAAMFGPAEYDKIIFNGKFIEEPLFAALVFPERTETIRNRLKQCISRPDYVLGSLLEAVNKVYSNVEWGRFDLVGFSLNYDQLFASLLFAKWLKRDFPKIKIVFGGTLVAGDLGRSILDCFQNVDWCVDGEGETALTSLLKCIESKADVGTNVPGLIYRQNRTVVRNPKKQLRTLKHLPDPDYGHYFWLLDNHPHLKKREIAASVPIEASRGCPNHCAFCSVRACWTGYRIRPPQEVAEQFKRMSDRYRINRFYIVDYNTLSSKFDSLMSCISSHNAEYNISYMIRASFSKSQMMAMKKAGVRRVEIGIEALTSRLLSKMNKGVRVIENMKAMKYCDELGIEQSSNVIIHFPTETQRDIDDSVSNIDYMSAYKPVTRLNMFELEYGSAVYKEQDKYGVCSVVECGHGIDRCLPREVAKRFVYARKGYTTKYSARRYGALYRRYERWKNEYNEARLIDRMMLCYYDCWSFLRIEDYRFGVSSLTLEKDGRDLYLFCDSIRSWNEIKARFPKWDPKEIKKVLGKLVKLKVMFREDDDYLSLAIRANGPRKA